MKLLRLLILMAAAVAVSPAATAQLTASQTFIEAPRDIFPLLDKNTRLDMIDYFESGLATPSTNLLQGKSKILVLSPEIMTISMTNASTYTLALLPAASDTLIALISTVASPAPDSNLAIYSSDWNTNLTGQMFRKPGLADWLTDEGKSHKGEVEGLVPFLLISYDYNPETATLTLSNNTDSFLSEDVYAIVEPYVRKQLQYVWNGKKFNPAR